MKQIWIKEFIKLNKVLAALALVHMALAVYHWLQIRGMFTVNVPINIWSDVISRNTMFFSRFENPLLISAIAVGIFQFYPEVARKRFRISCHLPMNENAMIAAMIIVGILSVTGLWLIDLAGAWFSARKFFPAEIYTEIPVIMFYWYIKAVILYTLAAAITLEPSWLKKLALGIMLGAYVTLISVSTYNSDRLYLLVITLLALIFIPVIYYPALRFRKGA